MIAYTTPPAVVQEQEQLRITATFLAALAKVEKLDGQANGTDGERGPFQIRDIYRREANRIAELVGITEQFVDSDRRSFQRSASMCRIVLTYWQGVWSRKGHRMDEYDLCSFHRRGPGLWAPDWNVEPLEAGSPWWAEWMIDRGRTARLRYYLLQNGGTK